MFAANKERVDLPEAEPTPDRVDLDLDDQVVDRLQELLPAVAAQTVEAIMVEVPSYAGALAGTMGASISSAVELALAGFLKLAAGDADPGTPLGPALEGAYALGRGEARSGRSMDALLAAYRVGARVAWREMSAVAGGSGPPGMPATTMAKFAELVFAYIDQLSAASVAGHTDELATTGRVRDRYLERLCSHLLAGADADVLAASAERAGWPAPRTLTAVLVLDGRLRGALTTLPEGTLRPREELPGLETVEDLALLMVPDVGGRDRARLLRSLAGSGAILGPTKPWAEVAVSFTRARRAHHLALARADGSALDTDGHLVELLLGADPAAVDDLRRRALAPLSGVRPSTAARLEETLRSWLLHQGRRDDVAAALFVHPQTVRYRMGQIRELYGEALEDPRTVLELTVALAATTPPAS